MAVTQALSAYIKNMQYDKIPERVVQLAKMAIYDCLAVSVAGAGAEGPRILKEYVLEQGGAPESAVPGTDVRTTAALSALLTGTMAHVHDYDDCSYTMRGHPSAVYVPAIWALGDKFNISGKKAIEAYLCAFEVVSRVGIFTQAGPPMANAWHQTKMLGGIGSAAAAAKILDLTEDETAMALGIVESCAGGIKENFGTMTKSFHAGLAARDGIIAAMLAKKGFTASKTGLEGENGLKTLIITGDPPGEEEIIKLSENYEWWDILSGNGIVFKRSPACALSHPGLDAVMELAVRENIDPDNVESIDIDTMDYVPVGLMHHDPKTGLEGKFSLEYCAAIAVLDKAAGISQFTTDKVDRARPLTHKVRVSTHKALPGRGSTRYNEAEAAVTLKDGRVLRNKVTFPLGHPDCERPFTWDHLRKKYVECVSQELPAEKVERSEELLRNLEQTESFREIVANLVKAEA